VTDRKKSKFTLISWLYPALLGTLPANSGAMGNRISYEVAKL